MITSADDLRVGWMNSSSTSHILHTAEREGRNNARIAGQEKYQEYQEVSWICEWKNCIQHDIARVWVY